MSCGQWTSNHSNYMKYVSYIITVLATQRSEVQILTELTKLEHFQLELQYMFEKLGHINRAFSRQ